MLIDFENVQPKNMTLLNGGPFKIKVFMGNSQSKIPLEMASALQIFGTDVEYIQIEGNGNNALDFHIAFYIGKLSIENPDSFFHIISKDHGFDPLIRHLKKLKILCQRSINITDIPLVKISNSKSSAEKVQAIIENLIKRGVSKPRTLKTLKSSIKALFVNKLDDSEFDTLFDMLLKTELVKINDGKISYHFNK